MSVPAQNDITRLLHDLAAGDAQARSRLLAEIYDELHRLAARQMRGERADHTLQTTALVHEAYLRLLGRKPPEWENRTHFFSSAAEVMRRILVDHARERLAIKRGGKMGRQPLDSDIPTSSDRVREVLNVDEALAELEVVDPRKANVVKLHFFAGMTLEEVGSLLEVSTITVKRDWRFARAWLRRKLEAGE